MKAYLGRLHQRWKDIRIGEVFPNIREDASEPMVRVKRLMEAKPTWRTATLHFGMLSFIGRDALQHQSVY